MSPTSAKLDLPKLSGDITASSVSAWISLCQDSFEVWSLLNPKKELSVALQILLAGLRLESPPAAQWWCENCEVLKKLKSWSEFVDAIRERFIPSSWKLDALATFYTISQGSSPFMDFVDRLEQARTTLGSAGRGYVISSTVMKGHLLFRANKLLCLRICALPTFDFAEIKVDALISLMSSTWLSMQAEGYATSSNAHKSVQSSSSSSTLGTTLPLSVAEREHLRSLNGCFHCRLHPKSLGWTPHKNAHCPGNAALGIPPRNNSVNFVTQDDLSSEGPTSFPSDLKPTLVTARPAEPVFAVLGSVPSCTSSEEEYDSDDSRYRSCVLGWNPAKGRCDTDSEEDLDRDD